jgi:hypothetical protein
MPSPFAAFTLLALPALLAACAEPVPANTPPSPAAGAPVVPHSPGKADGLGEEAPGAAVALALSGADPATPLLDAAALLAVQPRDGRETVSMSLRGALLSASGELGARVVEGATGHLRVDRYALSTDLGPGRLGPVDVASATVALPVRLTGGAAVEVARLFPSSEAAAAARLPGLAELPLDVPRALALPPGTAVHLPVTARLALNADGRFVTAAARDDARFGALLRSSVLGRASSVSQGLLVLEGRSALQVVRLGGQRLRLRWTVGALADAELSLNAGLGAGLTAIFLPSDLIDRARGLRRALDAGRWALSGPARAAERLRRFGDSAPLATRRLFDLALPAADAVGIPADAVEDAALRIEDAAASLAGNLEVPLETLDRQVLDRLETSLAAGSAALSRLERLAVRSLDLSAALSIQLGAKRHLGVVADFEIDLADPDAARAFERAVGGRVVWQGPAVGALFTGAPLLDLTTLDALADAPSDSEHPSVHRLAEATSDLRERHFALRLTGPGAGFALTGADATRRVELAVGPSEREAWTAHLWTRGHILGHGEDIQHGGVFAPEPFDPLRAGYFFGWRRVASEYAAAPARDALTEALNLLGRRGVDLGVGGLYDGEHPGEVTAALDVVITGEALAAVFDPAQATPAHLWRALRITAETWDNTFGLPYLASARRPDGLEQVPDAAPACEAVAAAWGGRYCFFFAEEFLPALDAARADPDPWARLRFLERWYRTGLLANPIGARLLVRFLSEVLVELDRTAGLHVRLDVRNRHDASVSASPGVRFGDAPAGALAEALGVLRRD